MKSIRINKFLNEANVCSRREADRLISSGEVTINGRCAVLGDRVSDFDEVCVRGKCVRRGAKKIYLAFHKPVGVICTTDRYASNTIVNFINYPERIYPVGRLDVESSGLILLTNDGSIVNTILKTHVEKEYYVRVNKRITADFLEKLRSGVEIDASKTFSDGKKFTDRAKFLKKYTTRPVKVLRMSDRSFSIILIEGKNRQIRRMCEALGYRVVKLQRVRIGGLELGDLKVGEFEELTSERVERLMQK